MINQAKISKYILALTNYEVTEELRNNFLDALNTEDDQYKAVFQHLLATILKTSVFKNSDKANLEQLFADEYKALGLNDKLVNYEQIQEIIHVLINLSNEQTALVRCINVILAVKDKELPNYITDGIYNAILSQFLANDLIVEQTEYVNFLIEKVENITNTTKYTTKIYNLINWTMSNF